MFKLEVYNLILQKFQKHPTEVTGKFPFFQIRVGSVVSFPDGPNASLVVVKTSKAKGLSSIGQMVDINPKSLVNLLAIKPKTSNKSDAKQ